MVNSLRRHAYPKYKAFEHKSTTILLGWNSSTSNNNTLHIHMTEVNYIFTEAQHNYMDISMSVRRMHAAAIDRPR